MAEAMYTVMFAAGWIRTVGSAQWRGTEIMSLVCPLPAGLRAKGEVEPWTVLPHTNVATTEAMGLTPVPLGGGMTRPWRRTVIRPSARTRTGLRPLTHGTPPGLDRKSVV